MSADQESPLNDAGAAGRLALSIAQIAILNRLLEEGLSLDETAVSDWLERIAPEHPELIGVLRDALVRAPLENASLERLGTLPKLQMLETSQCPSDHPQTGSRVGPHELVRPLGSGGMAEVWLARRVDGVFKREVALKLPLLVRFRKDLEARFAREREILASLSHPNIARMFDAGFTEDGQPYLALEYISGTSLTSYCDERHLSVRKRLELFQQVLAAVQYAHAHGVIHRDLKQSNILVTKEGQLYLLDFGIAKLLSEGEAKETELTQLNGRALTLDYAAPEQIRGMSITTAADVYALGVMLYELLTGERPYRLKRDSRGALEEAILQIEPRAPSRSPPDAGSAQARGTTVPKLVRALRGDLDTITLKALKKAPGERYATANAFGEDIGRFLSGAVVLARPDTLPYRTLKFARRHWIAISVVSLLLLTLTGGLAATSYEAKLASIERDAALRAQLRSLTQTAAARLMNGDAPAAMGIILDVLPHWGAAGSYTPEALNVFQESRAADAAIQTLIGHDDSVLSAAFFADGRRIVTASLDKSARIWMPPPVSRSCDSATVLACWRLGFPQTAGGSSRAPPMGVRTSGMPRPARRSCD
jgi:eukaryotic-like serine/threonine-protein kinase